MINQFQNFASTGTGTTSVFEALGIDWKTLILQMIAFVILVWLMKKFAYPWFLKSIDERQAKIEESSKLAEAASKSAEETQHKIQKLLEDARKDASEIVALAKTESSNMLAENEKKAKSQAEQIVMNAQAEIQKEILSAKKDLHNETLELVARATETIIKKKMTSDLDKFLIEQTIKESK